MSSLAFSPTLLGLPNEVIEEILLFLYPLRIVQCRQVCKVLLALIDGSVELRLRIELAIDGLLLNNPNEESTIVLIEHLKHMRTAFESLNPTWQWEVNANIARYAQYEVCGGLWARSNSKDIAEPSRKIRYTELISPLSRNVVWRTKKLKLDIDVTNFAFCPDQDVQLLVEWQNFGISRRIHFRTLSTNLPHPRAAVPYLDISEKDYPIWVTCSMLLHRAHFSLSFAKLDGFWSKGAFTRVRRAAISVINWTTGKTVMPCLDASDLAFLNDDSVLLLMDGRGTSSVELQVFSFDENRITRRYLFPFLPTRMLKARFITHPPYPQHSSVKQSAFFTPDPQVDILPIEFKSMASPRSSDNDPFLIVLSLHKFRELHSRLKGLEGTGSRAIPWEEWGPAMTRWLPTGIIKTVGLRSCYGAKLLGMFQPATFYQEERGREWDWGPSGNLVVLDFNPRPVFRGFQSSVNEDSGSVLVYDTPSTWTHPIAHGVVESSLPFRAFFHRQNPLGVSGKMHIEGTSIIRCEDHSSTIFSFLPPDEGVAIEDDQTAESVINED